jgi:hypothetical protein
LPAGMEELNFDSNRIKIMDSNFFERFESLRRVILSRNYLKKIDTLLFFSPLMELVDLSNSCINELGEIHFANSASIDLKISLALNSLSHMVSFSGLNTSIDLLNMSSQMNGMSLETSRSNRLETKRVDFSNNSLFPGDLLFFRNSSLMSNTIDFSRNSFSIASICYFFKVVKITKKRLVVILNSPNCSQIVFGQNVSLELTDCGVGTNFTSQEIEEYCSELGMLIYTLQAIFVVNNENPVLALVLIIFEVVLFYKMRSHGDLKLNDEYKIGHEHFSKFSLTQESTKVSDYKESSPDKPNSDTEESIF